MRAEKNRQLTNCNNSRRVEGHVMSQLPVKTSGVSSDQVNAGIWGRTNECMQPRGSLPPPSIGSRCSKKSWPIPEISRCSRAATCSPGRHLPQQQCFEFWPLVNPEQTLCCWAFKTPRWLRLPRVSACLWPMPQSGAVKLLFFFRALSRFSLSQFPSIFFFTSISEMSKSLLRHLLFIIFTSDDTSHQILFYFYVMSVIVYVLFFCSLSQKNSAILLLAFTGLREDGWDFSDCVGGKHPFTASIAAKLSFRTSL